MGRATADSSMRVSQVVKGEMSAKTTYQKSAKGPVSIAECAADGKSITLENVGRKVSVTYLRILCVCNCLNYSDNFSCDSMY